MTRFSTLKLLSYCVVCLMFNLAFNASALAAHTIADSVSENTTPLRTENSVCSSDVGVTSNGSTLGTEGYCPLPTILSTYEITYHFSLSIHQKMSSIIIWSNAGSKYNDGELRSFDMEVDYKKLDGSSATLVMSGVNIGDTANVNDPKTVTFIDNGSVVELRAVSAVRIDNLGGVPADYAFREVKADVETVDVNLKTEILLISSTTFPKVGDTVTYSVIVTNSGNDTALDVSLTSALPSNFTIGAFNGLRDIGNYNSATGVWSDVTIAANASVSLFLEGTVNPNQKGNTITTTTTAADNLVNDASDTTGDILSHSVIVADPKLSIVKSASPKINAAAGETIIYTYIVTNTGNQPISNVSLSDAHNGSGAAPVPANETLTTDGGTSGDSTDAVKNGTWDILAPNDVVTFQATYIVTQSDIDMLQ